jgi:phthiocerol/phenolphthiocerol synthesis type-I polyketide synthase E
MTQPDEDKVAIVGMAGRFPGAGDVDALWEQAIGGRIDVSRVAGAPGTVPARGVLAGTDRFDADYFGVPAREAAMLDPQQRLLLEVTQHALDDAGIDPARAPGAVSVYLACGPSQAGTAAGSLSERYERDLAGSPDFAATRVSYRLGLRGESMTVQTGCSSSLVAVHLAVQSLLSGQSDVAIAGGASFQADQSTGYGVEDGMITSPTGRCRPFDAEADGTLPGGGVAVVVLRRLPDALDAGAAVRAVIIGSAINNDGATKIGFMAPSPAGQAEVIATALAVAGVPAGSIGYVETHGTATKLGDAAEIEGLRRAFAVDPGHAACALGSLKANVGHLDRAAGAAGLIRAALAVEHGVVPPMAGFSSPNPDLGLDAAGFTVPAQPSAWPVGSAPRRAGVSAFGVGGTNAHVVLEQAPPILRPAAEPAPHLLALSGHTAETLAAQARDLADALNPGLALADVAATLANGRRQHPHRTHVVAHDLAEAAAALRVASSRPAATAPSVVFAFPGQGEEIVDGLPELYGTEPVYREAVEDCARRILAHGGHDVLDDLYGDRPHAERVELFRDMGRFQPALLAVEWALARLLDSWGVRADAVVGHSIGEVAAAAHAGVFDLDDACAFVVQRGSRMERTRPGATISVTLPAEALRPRLPRGTSIAALNGAELTTITGDPDAVHLLAGTLTAEGVTVRRLHIHRCPHGPAMGEAAGGLRAFAEELRLHAPAIPLLSNVSGDWAGPSVGTAGYWARHLCSPVRFAEQLRRVAELPAPVVVEVGPGAGLSRVIAYELGEHAHAVVPLAPPAPSAKAALLDALGRLWSAGAPVDLAAVTGRAGLIARLPATRFDHSRVWPAPRSTPAAPKPDRHADPAAWLYQPALVPVPAGLAPSGLLWVGGGAALRDAVGADARGHLEVSDVDGSAGILWWAGDAGPDLLTRAATLAETLAKAENPPPVWIVVPAGGPLPSPANLATAAALVAPQEYPGQTWRVLEVDLGQPLEADADAVAGHLLGCLARPNPAPVTRIDAHGAHELVAHRAWPDWRTRPLRDGGCYVITGGLGLVGRALTRAIAEETTGSTVVLLGRREAGDVPAGAEYHAVDVTDAATVSALFSQLRDRFGRIDGVVHAAGLTDTGRFALLADAGPDHLAEVCAAKLAGALAIRDALTPEDADFVLLCSSLSVVLGGVRFAGYVAANAALNDFAARQRDRRWISVAWDAWAEKHTEAGPGRYALSAEDGREVFRRALHAPGPVLLVSTGELIDRIAETEHQLGIAFEQPETGPTTRDPASVVHAVLAEVLGTVPADRQRDLRADGLESLTILQLVTRLRAALRAPVPLADAMRALTVAGLEDLARRAVGDAGEEFHIDPVPPAERYPTSSVQRRWLNLFDQGYGGLDIAVEVTGRVDTADLARAVEKVLDRHSGLRSVFHHAGHTWTQSIVPTRPVRVVTDLSEDALTALAIDLADTPFDLGTTPPFEVVVVRMGADRHVLVLHGHHVVFDGWSSSLFFTDVAAALRDELPGRPLQYVDYATAQTAHLASKATERAREHWRTHFTGAPGPVRVTPDAQGDSADRGEVLEFSLESAALRERARQRGTTPFALMMSAFGVLLHGLTGQTDLVVGTTAAGRPSPQTERIVGVFVNPLPLRLRLDPARPFGEFLDAVHGVLVGFHEYGHYPMEDLVASVEPFVGAGLNDTFHCYLLYQNYWRPRTGELEFRPLALDTGRHHKLMRELEIVLEDRDGELRGELWYLPSRFSPARARSWATTYRDLLGSIGSDAGSMDVPVAGLLGRGGRSPLR